LTGVVVAVPAAVLKVEALEPPAAADVAPAEPLVAAVAVFDEEPLADVPPSWEIRFCSICTRPLPPPYALWK